jgi:hypothetical protein
LDCRTLVLIFVFLKSPLWLGGIDLYSWSTVMMHHARGRSSTAHIATGMSSGSLSLLLLQRVGETLLLSTLLLSPLLFKTLLFQTLLLNALLFKAPSFSSLSFSHSFGLLSSLHFRLSAALLGTALFLNSALLILLLPTIFFLLAAFLFLLGLPSLFYLALSLSLALSCFGICFLLLRSSV